jgi:hypothetical protein
MEMRVELEAAEQAVLLTIRKVVVIVTNVHGSGR